MAITDGMVFIIVAQIGLYYTLYQNKTRLWRLLGGAGIIAVGLSAVMVEDTVPAFVFAGISIIIGGKQIITEVAEMTGI